LGTCSYLSKNGFDITYVKVDKNGFVDPNEVEKAITNKTILVSIMHANNEIGTIQDLETIGQICKKHNVLFHSDAVQSFTKVPIDVKKFNLAAASFSGHKVNGPKGVGALYLRKDLHRKTVKQIHGGHQEFDLRAGTENVTGIVGFGKATEIATEEDVKQMTVLRNRLIDNILKQIPDTMLNGSKENRLCNNANISFKYIEGESILLHLDMDGIAVSTGSACSSQSLRPSHVLKAICMTDVDAHSSIRFTLGRHTTEKEIDYTITKTKKIVADLRKMSH